MKEALLAGWVYSYRKNYKHWIVSLCRNVYFLSTYFTPPPLKNWIKPWRIVTSLTEMRRLAVETWSNLAYSLSLLPKWDRYRSRHSWLKYMFCPCTSTWFIGKRNTKAGSISFANWYQEMASWLIWVTSSPNLEDKLACRCSTSVVVVLCLVARKLPSLFTCHPDHKWNLTTDMPLFRKLSCFNLSWTPNTVLTYLIYIFFSWKRHYIIQ